MTKDEIQQSIEKLCEFLTQKGLKITFSSLGENAYYPILNEIVINTKQNLTSRYYSLLHETGHYLLRQKSDFSSKYLIDHTFGSRNKNSRIDVLREEVAAWDKANSIITVMNINGTFSNTSPLQVIGASSNARFTLSSFDPLKDNVRNETYDNLYLENQANNITNFTEINPFGKI